MTLQTPSCRTVFLILLFILAAAARIILVDRQGLWADEVFSLAMATGHSLEHSAASADPSRGDFVEDGVGHAATEWQHFLSHDRRSEGISFVLRAVRLSDTNPPLYYILLHCWTRLFGTSDRALRSLSIFFSIAALFLTFHLANRIGGKESVIPAIILFCFAPACLYYSTEGRMYSLLWLVVAATAVATVSWADRGPKWIPVFAWITASVAGLLTHFFFGFVWLAFVGWLLFQSNPVTRRNVLIASALVAILASPWYILARHDLSQWRITSGWLEVRPEDWSLLTSAWNGLFGHLSGRGVWGGGWRANAVAMALFTFCVGTLLWCRRRPMLKGSFGLMWLWLIAPVAAVLLLDAFKGTYALANYRYMTAGLPAAVMIAATALAQWPTKLRYIMLSAIVVLWLPAMRNQYENMARIWSPFREVAFELSSQTAPGDVAIVHSIPSGVLGIARYAEPDLIIAAWVEQLGQRKVENDLEPILQDRRRLFLVRAHEVWAPGEIEDELRRKATSFTETRREGIRLLQFTLPPEETLSNSAHPAVRTLP